MLYVKIVKENTMEEALVPLCTVGCIKLLSIGRKALTDRWRELPDDAEFDWEDEVEKLYNEKYGKIKF